VVDDRSVAPDWFPAEHPAMPPAVAAGRSPEIWACGHFHLPDGGGRPEDAGLAGLPVRYIEAQVEALRAGTRPAPIGA
jgi:cytochrome c553